MEVVDKYLKQPNDINLFSLQTLHIYITGKAWVGVVILHVSKRMKFVALR
jgi:hypothetical protein